SSIFLVENEIIQDFLWEPISIKFVGVSDFLIYGNKIEAGTIIDGGRNATISYNIFRKGSILLEITNLFLFNLTHNTFREYSWYAIVFDYTDASPFIPIPETVNPSNQRVSQNTFSLQSRMPFSGFHENIQYTNNIYFPSWLILIGIIGTTIWILLFLPFLKTRVQKFQYLHQVIEYFQQLSQKSQKQQQALENITSLYKVDKYNFRKTLVTTGFILLSMVSYTFWCVITGRNLLNLLFFKLIGENAIIFLVEEIGVIRLNLGLGIGEKIILWILVLLYLRRYYRKANFQSEIFTKANLQNTSSIPFPSSYKSPTLSISPNSSQSPESSKNYWFTGNHILVPLFLELGFIILWGFAWFIQNFINYGLANIVYGGILIAFFFSFLALKRKHPFFSIPWDWLIVGIVFLGTCLILGKIPKPDWMSEAFPIEDLVFLSQLVILPLGLLLGLGINFWIAERGKN
ncbi:MAG: hypothetical protein ACTSYU_12265, partial [Promethearchaeota archaeon]